ncbi:hypothetical protein A2U01_0056230, partial [Trifolium medium]|nr:hypothetical protein [Trifolium medium]
MGSPPLSCNEQAQTCSHTIGVWQARPVLRRTELHLWSSKNQWMWRSALPTNSKETGLLAASLDDHLHLSG